MYIFGLTGGIASGKSTVSTTLENLGFPIIDADIVARKVVEPGQPALKLIVKNFGSYVLMPSGRLDRAKLSAIIFNDKSKRQLLNKCTHPYIKKAMRLEVLKYFLKGKAAVIIDSPLLYESGGYISLMKKIIVVNCTEDQQIERLQERDSLSKEEALQRIRAQMPLKEKCQRADYVLDNCGDKEILKRQVFDLGVTLNQVAMKQKMLRAFLIFIFAVGGVYLVITKLFSVLYFYLFLSASCWGA